MKFEELITQLHDLFADDEVNIDLVKHVMESYKSNPEDWRKYAHFSPHRYSLMKENHECLFVCIVFFYIFLNIAIVSGVFRSVNICHLLPGIHVTWLTEEMGNLT